MPKYYIVIPNWNGASSLRACLRSLQLQRQEANIIVVDNASTDSSVEFLEQNYPEVILIKNKRNLGFAGGVNTGIRYAMDLDAKYVALFNNDAIADEDWLVKLVKYLDSHPKAGIATGKILESGKHRLDSTGEAYTIWGLPFPRGRDEKDSGQYDNDNLVFGASGGASLYRVKMLEEIGLFDEDFFAYYEDVDLSFRAQLAAWQVVYVPEAIAYHEIGATSSKIAGFTTYHTLKNLPWLLWKNVPWGLMPKIWPRLVLAWLGFSASALLRGQFGPFFKGITVGTILWPKKLLQRRKIQKGRKVSAAYINSIITHDLPPNARRLRSLRKKWWQLRRKKVTEQ